MRARFLGACVSAALPVTVSGAWAQSNLRGLRVSPRSKGKLLPGFHLHRTAWDGHTISARAFHRTMHRRHPGIAGLPSRGSQRHNTGLRCCTPKARVFRRITRKLFTGHRKLHSRITLRRSTALDFRTTSAKDHPEIMRKPCSGIASQASRGIPMRSIVWVCSSSVDRVRLKIMRSRISGWTLLLRRMLQTLRPRT